MPITENMKAIGKYLFGQHDAVLQVFLVIIVYA